ncbi:RidA family protein [Alphaproteobacteria bacterium]|nr:RidA family protein [Alphaproteobacteria bacterium]
MIATITPEDRLRAAGLELPTREGPTYDYLPVKRDGNTIYLAGTLGKEMGAVQNLGKVGAEIEETEAARQMQICALQALNWLKEAAGGDLNRVTGILQLKCYVACTLDFEGISRIADHATGVFVTAFGEAGKHPRSVLGMMRLPQDAPVMIDLIAGVRE